MAVLAVALVMIQGPVASVAATASLAPLLSAHSAILIMSDRNFTPENGVTAGSGTEEDPYVIGDWDIDASVSWVPVRFPGGTLRAGIHIANTTAHVRIRNVQVHDGGRGNLGIAISNATNVVVDSAKVWNGNAGVFLTSTSNSTVISSEFYNLIQGVVVGSGPYPGIEATGNVISGNVIHDIPEAVGINLVSASMNVVSKNVIFRTLWGIFIQRESTRNLVAENHIFESRVGVSVFDRSNYNVVRDNVIEKIDGLAVGIGLFEAFFEPDSIGNTVSYNEIRNVFRGIKLIRTTGNDVVGNRIQANQTGIEVFFTSQNRIAGNMVTAPLGILICSAPHNSYAPPPNNLKATDKPIEHCKK